MKETEITEESNIALTKRELEVLKLVIEGKNNIEIGKKLMITRYTAKAHVSSVLKKLGCKTRIDAIIKVMGNGIIPHQDSKQP